MTSSKTTVLGIRLDHERRGWIEAEAAREGMSIRAFFERMIDEARFMDQEPTERMEREPALGGEPETRRDIAAVATATGAEWLADQPDFISEPPGASTVSSTESPGLCDDLVSVVTLSGRVLREALGLPRSVISAAMRPFRQNRAS